MSDLRFLSNKALNFAIFVLFFPLHFRTKSSDAAEKKKFTEIIIVTTQPNFNATQSNFNPGWGYMVLGFNHHHKGTMKLGT